MHQNLQKVLNLAKKTGDKLIVLDSAKPDNIYVVMPFEEYEKMTIGRNEVRGLTEDELLDKINRDIAIWKSEQKIDPSYAKASEGKSPYAKVSDDLMYDDDSEDCLDGLEGDDYNDDFPRGKISEDKKDNGYKSEMIKSRKTKKVKNHWRIPESRKKAAEEIIEEDRQYLEEINY